MPVLAVDFLDTPSHLHSSPVSPLPAFSSYRQRPGAVAVMSHRLTGTSPLVGGRKPLCTRVPQTVMDHLLPAPLGER